MKKEIFISYRREDSSFFAAKLFDHLELIFPGQIFLDISSINAGEDFINKLKASVTDSKVVIAVIGRYWQAGSNGDKKLGEKNDFVTEEIGTALESKIPVIPVLMEDTQMPSIEILPESLKGLVRQNAIFISHAHFNTDIDYLVNAIYFQLKLKPPTALEKFIEAIPGIHFRFNERLRDRIANYNFAWTLLSAIFFIIVNVFTHTTTGRYLDADLLLGAMVYIGISLILNIIGLNSARRHKLALFGTVISILMLIATFVLGSISGYSQNKKTFQELWDPWLKAMEIAEIHSEKPELPATELSWSGNPPFSGPPPQVECACLNAMNKPKGRLSWESPYNSGASLDIKNNCENQVLFLIARWRQHYPLKGFNPWISIFGNEFTAIILSPRQIVKIPLDGTFGAVYQPWRC